MSFNLGKDHSAVATVTDVRNNSRAVHTYRRWMLRSDNPKAASWQIGRLRTAEQSVLKQPLNDRSCARNVIAMCYESPKPETITKRSHSVGFGAQKYKFTIFKENAKIPYKNKVVTRLKGKRKPPACCFCGVNLPSSRARLTSHEKGKTRS